MEGQTRSALASVETVTGAAQSEPVELLDRLYLITVLLPETGAKEMAGFPFTTTNALYRTFVFIPVPTTTGVFQLVPALVVARIYFIANSVILKYEIAGVPATSAREGLFPTFPATSMDTGAAHVEPFTSRARTYFKSRFVSSL